MSTHDLSDYLNYFTILSTNIGKSTENPEAAIQSPALFPWVFFGTRLKSVDLFSGMVGAEKPLATGIKCEAPSNPGTTFGDQMKTLAICSNAFGDGGYIVTLRTGGFAGLTVATVAKETLAGPNLVTPRSLTCGPAVSSGSAVNAL